MADVPRKLDPNFFTAEFIIEAVDVGLNPSEVGTFFQYTCCHAEDTAVFKPKVNAIRIRCLSHINIETAKKIYDYLLDRKKYLEFKKGDKIYAYIPGLHEVQPLDHPRKPTLPYPPKKWWTKKHSKIDTKWKNYEELENDSDDTTEHYGGSPKKTEKDSKLLPSSVVSCSVVSVVKDNKDSNEKPPPDKQRPVSDNPINILQVYYHEKLKAKYGEMAVMSYTIAGRKFKDLLKTSNVEVIKICIDRFFEINDKFIQDRSFSVNDFPTRFNALLQIKDDSDLNPEQRELMADDRRRKQEEKDAGEKPAS